MPLFSAGPSSRVQRFRQQHQIGHYLHGEIVSLISPGRAWIRIGDLTLVAAIRRVARPGDILTFRVESLEPEIILKEITETGLMPSQIAQFCKARSEYERQFPVPAGPMWTQRYLDILRHDTARLAVYLHLRSMIRAMNARLDASQTLSYCPWVFQGLAESLCIKTTEATVTEYLGYGEYLGEPIWITLRQNDRDISVVAHLPIMMHAALASRNMNENLRISPLSRQSLHTIWERLQPTGNNQTFHRTV